MLRLQAAELRQAAAEREREAGARHRAQAELVYMWHAPVHVEPEKASPLMTVEAYERNSSLQPIYDLRFEWKMFSDLPDRLVRIDKETYHGEAPLMPSAMDVDRAPIEPDLISGWLDEVSAAVTFRDRAGVWWRTHATGFLEELPNQLEAQAIPEAATDVEQAPIAQVSDDRPEQ